MGYIQCVSISVDIISDGISVFLYVYLPLNTRPRVVVFLKEVGAAKASADVTRFMLPRSDQLIALQPQFSMIYEFE